jgi:hypothetical protein
VYVCVHVCINLDCKDVLVWRHVAFFDLLLNEFHLIQNVLHSFGFGLCRSIHTYIHAYIHTYTHTHIHTYIHTYGHTYIHTCIPLVRVSAVQWSRSFVSQPSVFCWSNFACQSNPSAIAKTVDVM